MQFSARLFSTRTSRIVYSLIRIAVGCWSGFLLTGCAVSVRNDPQYQLFKEQFMYVRFQTQQDLFLVEYPVTHEITLEAPGSSASVPLTVQDYYTNPNPSYWSHTEAYFNRYGSHRTNQRQIVDVVKEGTMVRVTKITRSNNRLIGPCYELWGRLEDRRYETKDVSLTFVFHGGAFDHPLFPKLECLREI